MTRILSAPLSAFLFSSFLFGLVATPTSAQSRTLYGVLDAKVRLLRFVVIVDKDGSAQLESLDEGSQKFKLEPFALSDGSLEFELKASKATYTSKYDSKTRSYRGQWKQGRNELDLDFQVVDSVPADSATEIWQGEVSALGRKMPLRFRIYDRGTHAVLLDSPSQRAGGFSGTIEEKDGTIIYRIPALRGTFEGELSEDKKVLKGTWTQGLALSLELKRISKAEASKTVAPPKRPQTPKAPFPYESTDVSIKNESAKLALAGTLTIPKDQSRKYPCVILISGSGAQDRDESLMDHKPFWILADHLGRQGIACLRFDDRGTAKSTGDHSKATSADFATDVSAIIDYLKKHPRIDPGKIGLCGHSEGGLIAPITATQRDDVAFIVMLAGPGVNGEKILRNQLVLIMKAGGASQADVDSSAFIQDQLLKLATSDATIDDDQRDKILDKVVEQYIEKYPDKAKDKELISTRVRSGLERLSTPWMKYFLTHDPAPVLAKVKCPVLVLNGSKDTQVDPELNLPAIKQAFESAGKTNYEIELLENLNHLFQNSKTGGLEEYQSIEETFAPKALKRVSDWINKTAR